MVEKLKEYGFYDFNGYLTKWEGVYKLIYYKSTERLELFIHNKDKALISLGEIDGEKSLQTILNLIKHEE